MRQAARLFFKSVCVILPVIVICLYIRKNPLAYMDNETPYYLWNRDKVNTTQEQYYRVIILGDSTANAAYIPEILSNDTINLALGGTTPIENYYTLCDWLQNNDPPDICYISFTDFYLQEENCFWTRTIYSHKFRTEQNIEILKAAYKYNESSILTEHCLLDLISYELYLPDKYITSFLNAGFNQRYQDNILAQQLNELHGGRYMARGVWEYMPSDIIQHENFYVTPLFEEYYRKIIRLCQEKQIEVRIIKLPLPESTFFTDNYEKELYAYYSTLKNDFPDITFEWIPSYDEKYFADSLHANSHGALRFSTELKKSHPEDFDDTVTSKQIAAINDSIKAENKVEQILKWICGKDYTVILNDESGMLESVYQESIQNEFGETLPMLNLIHCAAPADFGEIYFVSGINNTKQLFTVYQKEESLVIQMPDTTITEWKSSPSGALDVLVIDNYNHEIVTMKSFKYIDDVFIE